MPMRAKELRDAQVRSLQHPGGKKFPVKVAVGGVAGLYIQIQPDTHYKSWLFRTRFGPWQETALDDGTVQRGRAKREIGLGAYPEVKLAEARERAAELKKKIQAGIDPIAERRAERAAAVAAAGMRKTFAEAFNEYADKKVTRFKTDKQRQLWRAMVENHAFPAIGKKAVAEINRGDIEAMLAPIWTEKHETARRLRQRVEATLDYAVAKGWRAEGLNPARMKGNLDKVLVELGDADTSENYPALKLADAARWWQALQQRQGMGAKALAFQALTATRTGAIRFATWDEINIKERLWTIQPGRQSSKISAKDKKKSIPLTDDMVALLEGLERLEGSNLVFWAPKGGAMSDATLGKVMRSIHEADLAAGGAGFVDERTNAPAVPHGLRSTFRTWVSDKTNFDGDMAEVALFHKVGSKVQQAYDRADQIEKRRVMMAAWGQFLRTGV